MKNKRIYNFSAGPAMLPTEVMEKAQEEFLSYQGMGASLIEISHRSPEFIKILEETDDLFRKIANIPNDYKILFIHGGARMQFSAIPLNLMALNKSNSADYIVTGSFSKMAFEEACKMGQANCLISGAEGGFRQIPQLTPELLNKERSYLHLTANNTIYGTQWQHFPVVHNSILVGDFTSEILSRVIDFKQFGCIYAGLQKTLGPSGVAVVIIREDLLNKALPRTPNLLDYSVYAKSQSMPNTPNTFAIYMVKLVLEWLDKKGGVAAIECENNTKSEMIYREIDSSNFYTGYAHENSRSMVNITMNLPSNELEKKFIEEALKHDLYSLGGHRSTGGIRASMYNAMPLQGAKDLASFMVDFEKKWG